MERTDIKQIKNLYGNNYLGTDELKPFLEKLGILIGEENIPEFCFNHELHEELSRDYLLILGVPGISIRIIRNAVGTDPGKCEPCFYNQDWYLNEKFMDEELNYKWFLLRKDVIENTRAANPESILKTSQISFPKAIMCVYAFFAYYFAKGIFLWKHDFVWCSDIDHNGDRVYVGKYEDIDGINKNGFSIHRHLALRSCYASIDAK